MVPPDPDIEQMKLVVCTEGKRPEIPSFWESTEVSIHIMYQLLYVHIEFVYNQTNYRGKLVRSS